jgi:Flp pilus assembly protein protease CpaA
MTLTITVLVAVLFSAWLIACAVCDWRNNEIPNLLAMIPLIGAVLWSAWNGNAPATIFAVMSMFAINFERKPAVLINILSLAFAIIFIILTSGVSIENTLPIFLIFVFSMLWIFEKTGGADFKIITTIILLFGSPAFIYAVVAGGLAGLIAHFLKKKDLPYVIPIAAGTITYFILRLI